MNKRIILLISALIIGTSPISILTASTDSSELLFPFKNKALNALAWSSLGVIFTTISYRTMCDVYNKIPPKHHTRYLGDKILMSIGCWAFAIVNALEAYKSYKLKMPI